MTANVSLLNAFFGICDCRAFFDCTLPVDSNGGVLLWLALSLYMCKALRTISEDYFLPCLHVFEGRLELSHDVASTTLIAAGTSASLLLSNFVATVLIASELGVGTVIGSCVFQLLVITGVTGYLGCRDVKALTVFRFPLLRDASFYAVALIELVTILLDGKVFWYEALIMLITYAVYCVFMNFNTRIMFRLGVLSKEAVDKAIEEAAKREESDDLIVPASPGAQGSVDAADDSALRAGGVGELPPVGTVDEPPPPALPGAAPAGQLPPVGTVDVPPPPPLPSSEGSGKVEPTVLGDVEAAEESLDVADKGDRKIERPSSGSLLTTHDPLSLLWAATMPLPELKRWQALVFSLLFVSFLAYVMVDGMTRAAIVLNVSSLAVGLIGVAPAVSSLAVASAMDDVEEGAADLTVANSLSASLFDVLVSLGLPWFLFSLGGPVEFNAGVLSYIQGNLIALAVMLALFLIILLAQRWRLTQLTSQLFLVAYGIYVFGNFVAMWSGAGQAVQ
eukprot:gb/GFBE01017900.1/.p1 GENE.gb/GFBE01017900.1/~~gb/GFBE01017900.1/.p1  ORF type:complete len:506 (+),score=105.89 gb/GFBE01017900.1/:1-1518(+)